MYTASSFSDPQHELFHLLWGHILVSEEDHPSFRDCNSEVFDELLIALQKICDLKALKLSSDDRGNILMLVFVQGAGVHHRLETSCPCFGVASAYV